MLQVFGVFDWLSLVSSIYLVQKLWQTSKNFRKKSIFRNSL